MGYYAFTSKLPKQIAHLRRECEISERFTRKLNSQIKKAIKEFKYHAEYNTFELFNFFTSKYRFVFVVEMEMTILGSRHFLLFPSQIQFLSPKLRSCVVRKFLGFVSEFFIANFDNIWKSVVSGVSNPSRDYFSSCLFML